MNNFIYDIPTKVYFGENQLEHLGEELNKYGKKVLLHMEEVQLRKMAFMTKL